LIILINASLPSCATAVVTDVFPKAGKYCSLLLIGRNEHGHFDSVSVYDSQLIQKLTNGDTMKNQLRGIVAILFPSVFLGLTWIAAPALADTPASVVIVNGTQYPIDECTPQIPLKYTAQGVAQVCLGNWHDPNIVPWSYYVVRVWHPILDGKCVIAEYRSQPDIPWRTITASKTCTLTGAVTVAFTRGWDGADTYDVNVVELRLRNLSTGAVGYICSTALYRGPGTGQLCPIGSGVQYWNNFQDHLEPENFPWVWPTPRPTP